MQEVSVCPSQHGNQNLTLGERRAHVGKGHFDDGHVLLRIELVLLQHRPQPDIDGAAGRVRADDLALQILDGADGAVLQHHVLVGVVARRAVLERVGDDAQIGHAGILDRDGERRIGQQRDVDVVRGECRNHLRRAAEMDRVHRVGLALMPRDAGLGEEDRRQVVGDDHPGDADL